MNNLTKLYSNHIADSNENLYLYFSLGECKYAINTNLVVEIMKLPHLEYPQKLPNNVVGLLNYNNFMINILDVRFYLDIKITPYSSLDHLLIVQTDEAIFGLLINRVDDIIPLEQSKIEHFPFSGEDDLIENIYHYKGFTLSMLNLYALENLVKKGVESSPIDIPSLFPQDEVSSYKLMQRALALEEKTRLDLSKNVFSQDKLISFSLNNNTYCINLEYVCEFLKTPVISPVPCTPDYITGLMTLRGDFVAVVDLKKFFDLSSKTVSEKNRVIVVETDEFKVGFLVDEIFSIIEIPEELIEQNSHGQQIGQSNQYIQCEVVFDDKLYTILDMKSVLSDEKFYIDEKN